MPGQPDGESQRPGGVPGEIPGALRFGLAEGPDVPRVEVAVSARVRDLTRLPGSAPLLELLVRADTKTVTRDELMTQALGRRLLPTDRSLDTHVSNLRRKLMKTTDRVSVQSVRGTGYALALASSRVAVEESEP